MIRYAITSDVYTPGTAGRLASDAVDYLQLRARSLQADDLATLARAILAEIATVPHAPTRLLINARLDIAKAVAVATDTPVGVHLTSRPGELTPAQVRQLFASTPRLAPSISVSCHTLEEVAAAHRAGADLVLFGPVFEKRVANQRIVDGSGLALLGQAVIAAAGTPVLALGGVTHRNTAECLAAGAAGIAAIRLFA